MKVYMLLDASGSMVSNWIETLGAINSFVTSRADSAIKTITLAAHDASDRMRYRTLRNSVSIKEWRSVSSDEVSPGGGTPLYDAMGKMLTQILSENPERALVVVITDGYENSSVEWNEKSVKVLMNTLKEKNVEFTFIGADFDAFNQASGVGVHYDMALNMTKGNYRATFTTLRNKAETFARASTRAEMTGAVAYTSADRTEAAGNS